VHLGRHRPLSLREALLQKAPEAAWLGSRDGDSRRHHALKKKLPFVGGECRLVRHGPTPLLKFWSALLRLLLHQPLASYRRSTKIAALACPAGSTSGFSPRASILGFQPSPTPGGGRPLSEKCVGGRSSELHRS